MISKIDSVSWFFKILFRPIFWKFWIKSIFEIKNRFWIMIFENRDSADFLKILDQINIWNEKSILNHDFWKCWSDRFFENFGSNQYLKWKIDSDSWFLKIMYLAPKSDTDSVMSFDLKKVQKKRKMAVNTAFLHFKTIYISFWKSVISSKITMRRVEVEISGSLWFLRIQNFILIFAITYTCYIYVVDI